MRLPWGSLNEIVNLFLRDVDFSILGCLSFEERCRRVPEQMFNRSCKAIDLLEIRDPPNAFPDYSEETQKRIKENRQKLDKAGIVCESPTTNLLVTEDELLDILYAQGARVKCSTIILDITSMPKRYFCFFLKRLLLPQSVRNVIVTYTEAGVNGYASGHLAEDPMTCDHLPGYAAPLPPRGDTLVISLGFESLSIRALLELYRGDKRIGAKILLPFPPDGISIKRGWRTLIQITEGEAQEIIRENLEVVAAWDADMVYRTLERWDKDSGGLTLAPFGPKPHSLGMTLFAIKQTCGLYYTQPKAYNPDYSKGYGTSWAYVVKWDGVPCFDRLAQDL